MMSPYFPWRQPQQEGWSDALRDWRLEAKDAAALSGEQVGRLRSLANQQMAFSDVQRLAKIAQKFEEKIVAADVLRPLRFGILSDSTTDFFASDLAAVSLARGMVAQNTKFPFGAVQSIALAPSPSAEDGPLDVILLMLSARHWGEAGKILDSEDESARLAAAVEELSVLTEGVRANHGAQPIVATVPIPPDMRFGSAEAAIPNSQISFLTKLNAHIAQGAFEGRWLVWDLAAAASGVGAGMWHDPAGYYHGKLPFASQASPILADDFSRVLAANAGLTARCVIFDLDNTMWGGVIGDDGLAGIELGQGTPKGEAFLAVQRLGTQFKDRGIVLAVCSKNTESVALEAIENHPEMLLRAQDFAVIKANWSDKASNISAIADALDLGTGSFLFVDDNPAERAWVREALPDVMVPELGADPALYPTQIMQSGYLEQLVPTREDISRVASYTSRAQSKSARAPGKDYGEYLRSLEMQMSVQPFDEIGRRRIAQLINKSNQFNLTTKRYTEAQVKQIEADENRIGLQIRLKDRLADHGMICVVILNEQDDALEIDTLLMSCRVLERGVENEVMNAIFKAAKERGKTVVRGSFIPTAKNALVVDFYDKMGFTELTAGEADGEDMRQFERSVADYSEFTTAVEPEA